jgi:hypothetical protein
MGMPVDHIKQKMINDGVDPALLDGGGGGGGGMPPPPPAAGGLPPPPHATAAASTSTAPVEEKKAVTGVSLRSKKPKKKTMTVVEQIAMQVRTFRFSEILHTVPVLFF